MLKKLKHLFIPHQGNNFRPTFLEKMSAGIMLGLLVCTFTIANLHALLWVSSDWLVSAILPSVLIDLTNEKRSGEALTTLTHNPLLDLAAQKKAEDMAMRGYFAHYSPDGRSPWYWFDQVGYQYLAAGENLAVHFTDSSAVVDAWMNSPTHRDNIMNGMYTEIGIGTATGEYNGVETVFVVQLFGIPQARAAVLGEQSVPVNEAPADTQTEKIALVTDSVPTNNTEHKPTPFLNELSTTTGPLSGVIHHDMGGQSTPETGVFARSAVAPSNWLSFVYGLLAGVVTVALILSIVIEWRRQHPVQVAYAGGLLAGMALLTYVHLALTSNVLIV